MGLFGIDYRSAVLNNKVSSTIDKIKDEKKLMKIVIDARNFSVFNYAISKITDNNILYEIAMNQNLNAGKSDLALDRITDKEVINRIISELPTTHRFVSKIYDKIENPPFELNFKMSSKKASDNLLKDLDNMDYPKDRDKLIMVAKKHSFGEATKKAIEKLPYPEEVEELKNIFNVSISDIAKEEIIKKLPIKEERNFFVNILMNGHKNKIVTKLIGKKLDSSDELLDKEVCLNCGALDSVKKFGGYEESIDEFVSGYRCNKCNKEVSLPNGLGEVKCPTIKLREFINK